MFTSRVIKRCLIPAVVLIEIENTDQKSQSENEAYCRPSDLPIYTPEPEKKLIKCQNDDEVVGYVENVFREIRCTFEKYNQEFQAYKKVGVDQFEKSRDELQGLINYLQEEDNTLPKAGAIGIGALTGFIFGLRGGIFKRTLYATTGALGMSALCYPKEAALYTEVGLTEAKKYLTIAYNFAYGVKKDDPPLELPSLPKLPSSISEVWDNVKSTATSFVLDEKQPEQTSSTEQVPKK